MTTITISLDSVIPSDPSATAWARGYAKFLAAQLTEETGEEHTVKLGENNDLPSSEHRDLCNRAYDRWCGLSDAEQAAWIG